jgi:hypothetical protein
MEVCFVSQLEYIREMLYKVLEKGTKDDILRISQELDKLIILYMQQNGKIQQITA